MQLSVLELPVLIQILLGTGYLAYRIAYASINRGHTMLDAFFMALAFGLPSAWVVQLMGGISWISILASVLLAVMLGLLWRRYSILAQEKLYSWFAIDRRDNLSSALERLIAEPGLAGKTFEVELKDGRIFRVDDAQRLTNCISDGFYMGSDGSVLMVVEQSFDKDYNLVSDITKKSPDTPLLPMTYIPSSEIKSVEMYVTSSQATSSYPD